MSLNNSPSPHAGVIAFVYRHVLHREAAPAEIAEWSAAMESGVTVDGLIELVSGSDEAAGVAEDELDASLAAVGNLSCLALGRKPTPSDVAGWTERLRSGRSVVSLVDEVLGDPEVRLRYELPERQLEEDAIAFVYRHALGREPTEHDLQLWSKHMRQGLSFHTFLHEVRSSEEGRTRASLLEAPPSAEAIAFVYRHALGREPTEADALEWSAHLRSGLPFERFLSVILASEEARHRSGVMAEPPDAEAIAFVYRHALHREPTESDQRTWISYLASGLPFQRFLLDILACDEARAKRETLRLEAERAAGRAGGWPSNSDGTGAEEVIDFVYKHALGREPTEADALEWSAHLRSGLPFERFLSLILASEEARGRSGVLVEPPDADAIAFVYRHALHREPTESDQRTWTSYLASGLPFQRFLLDILACDEARARREELRSEAERADARVGGWPSNFDEAGAEDVIGFVYRHALGREPTEADRSEWSGHLRSEISFPRFLRLIVESDEARARAVQMPDPTTADAIAFVYRHALGREPTAADVQVWMGHLAAGLPFPRFLVDLAGSDEALRHAEAVHEDPDPEAIAFVFRHAFGRRPSDADVAECSRHLGDGVSFQRFLIGMMSSEEARTHAEAEGGGGGITDGQFVAHLFEICLGRCAMPAQIQDWTRRFAELGYRRPDVAMSFISAAIGEAEGQGDAGGSHDSGRVSIMGTDRTFDAAAWASRAAEIEAGRNLAAPGPLSAPYVVRPHAIRVSAIASLYKGGRYIRKFLDNMTRQSLGENFELIVVDANSPDGEREVIEEYRKTFPNIRYERMNYRIGIYDAWNVGVELARGDYLTNTNLDDLRRSDSLELQAATLDAVPFADVVYQDFFYSLDPELSFEQVEAFGFRSDLPIVTPNNLLAYNSPHNAPMWRRKLHAEVGLFDTTLKSAGDHDFWLRCLQAGKVFYKINTPHVVYYQNPDGISTRPGTLGVVEGQRILKRYGRRLLSPEIYRDRAGLSSDLSALCGAELNVDATDDPYGRIQLALLSLADGRALPRAEGSRL